MLDRCRRPYRREDGYIPVRSRYQEDIMRTTRLAAAVAAALSALTFGTVPAVAGQPQQVDPSTLQPALNPDFDWSCYQAGSGITCKGSFEPTYHEPIGLFCDGQEVWIQGSGREFMTRWHTADGLATKTVAHLDYPADVFSLAQDGTGPSVTIRGHFNRHYVYPDPGVRETRVLTEVGAIYLVNEQGRGITLHDTGRVTFAPGQDFEEIDTISGVHDVYSNDPTFIDDFLCEQLT